MHSFKFFFWLNLVITGNCFAEQLKFNRQEQDDNFQFHYQWQDHQRQVQSLDFQLTKAALFERFRHFRAYKNELAEKNVHKAIRKHLRKEPIKGVQVYFRQQQGNSYIDIKGRDSDKVEAAYRQLAKLEQDFFRQYLTENFYHSFTSHDLIRGVKPDHVSIADASIEDLRPMKQLILDKVSIRNIRQVTEYVLSFVQNIPYSTLESRVTSSGAGFNPPLKLLWQNQGDCDSKLTLTAALLRTLMPRIKMLMIYIDQHAFIGINIPFMAGEMTITEDNLTYVLAEPAGPTLLKLGVIAPESEQAILQGRYTTEIYHPQALPAEEKQQQEQLRVETETQTETIIP
ncbi:hypothetical protein [Thalassomonas haliotis]|uniref:Transglutaminase-like domain-containing protein n=1 Tax=Thalassomonas haliotis TaxID=485448 RepID=A0ABY7VHG7_9GAMM|nr:hypothetical protein [Thalassomonas haliotis]WDE12383.1 hypothetical protein H3N35_02535 [Thalassomonas haliotis]